MLLFSNILFVVDFKISFKVSYIHFTIHFIQKKTKVLTNPYIKYNTHSYTPLSKNHLKSFNKLQVINFQCYQKKKIPRRRPLYVIYLKNMLYTSCDYLKKTSIKVNVATDEYNSQNKTWHWTNDEIGVAVQSWLWVQVELMAW